MNKKNNKNYIGLEIGIKVVLPIIIGLSISGVLSIFSINLTGILKNIVDSLIVGLLVAGILNALNTFSFLKKINTNNNDKFLDFIEKNCINRDCWHGIEECNKKRNEDKSIIIGKPPFPNV